MSVWFVSIALACLWDRDTLASEMAGLPDVERVIYGDFPRYPDRYYAMRLERVSAEVAEDEQDLALYDDAAVALDRLGRSDEALAWMDRKQAVMDALEEVPDEVRYRTHANRGTFLAHRWIRAGARRDDAQGLHDAIAEIEAALAVNPEAHFGREVVQLQALHWIRDAEPFQYGLHSFVERGHAIHDNDEQDETLEGLRGLITLGAAWESVDTYVALHNALSAAGRSQGAYLATLRARELAEDGGRSLQPGAPRGEALVALFPLDQAFGLHDPTHLVPLYEQGRVEADARHAERTRFIEERLVLGMHPDTHSGFWDPVLPEAPPPADHAAGPPPVQEGPLPSASTARSGCGCATLPAPAGGLVGLLLLLGRRRARTAGPYRTSS